MRKKGKKGCKKILPNNLSLWLAIIGVALFAIGTVAVAGGAISTVINVSGDYNFNESEAAAEPALGGVVFDDEQIVGDLILEQALIFDNGDLEKKVLQLELDATASDTYLLTENIWITDAYVRIDTATTSAISYLMGTTSASVIARDGGCGADGSCAAATANMASVLDTGTAAASTADNVFFKMDYQGVDTRDATGVRYVVPGISGEYLSCFASTTPDDGLAMGGQGATCVFEYYQLR